jgi:hypothetical protein
VIYGFPASEPSLEVIPEPQPHQIPLWASRERTLFSRQKRCRGLKPKFDRSRIGPGLSYARLPAFKPLPVEDYDSGHPKSPSLLILTMSLLYLNYSSRMRSSIILWSGRVSTQSFILLGGHWAAAPPARMAADMPGAHRGRQEVK